MSVAPSPPATLPGIPVLGSFLEFRRDPLAFMTRVAALPGDTARYRLGSQEVHHFKNPEDIQAILVTEQHAFTKGRALQWARRFLGDGLLTSEGAHHTRQRRLSQPAFHRSRIASYGPVMTDAARATASGLREGHPFDLGQEMTALTLRVVGRTLFGFETDGEALAISRSLDALMAPFSRFALPFSGLLDLLPLPSNRRFRAAKEHLDRTVYRIIEERRRVPGDRGDLLSMLLLAQDEGGGGGMSDQQLRDEAMTLFLAGHETTANALTWTFYLLSQNPREEALFHEELDAVLPDGPPGFDDIPRLPRTTAVFAEALRLYPPAWGFGRRVRSDVVIGGVALRAGSVASLSPFTTHRNPRFFPDPLRFDLGRWTEEARASRPRFAYFPFGGGARQCIGEPFAWMEGVLVLATLGREWRLRLPPGTVVPPRPLITLRPGARVVVTPERRSRARI